MRRGTIAIDPVQSATGNVQAPRPLDRVDDFRDAIPMPLFGIDIAHIRRNPRLQLRIDDHRLDDHRAGWRTTAVPIGTRPDIRCGLSPCAIPAGTARCRFRTVAEISQNLSAQTCGGIAIPFHRAASGQCRLLGPLAVVLIRERGADGVLDTPPVQFEIEFAPQQRTGGRLPVPSGTSGLLVVLLHAGWNAVVDHPAHIGLVDTHAERGGGCDDIDVVVQEPVLHPCLARLIHSGVEVFGVDSGILQRFSQFLGPVSRHAVDDAALPRMPTGIVYDVFGAFRLAVHPTPVEEQVRSVEAGGSG